jgi:hypothetical protein
MSLLKLREKYSREKEASDKDMCTGMGVGKSETDVEDQNFMELSVEADMQKNDEEFEREMQRKTNDAIHQKEEILNVKCPVIINYYVTHTHSHTHYHAHTHLHSDIETCTKTETVTRSQTHTHTTRQP